MSTFSRYFLHYAFVILGITLILGIIMKLNNLVTHKYIIIAYLLCMICFIGGMAAITSSMSAQVVTVTIPYKDETSKMIYLSKVDEIIKRETKRNIKRTISDEIYVYESCNKYINWLTNDIQVNINSDKIQVVIPKGYANKIRV